MCQAYDAEYRSICRSEDRASRDGFVAAYRGESEATNPHHPTTKYEFEAWAHGWRCYHQRLLPYSIEKEVRYRDPEKPDWGDASQEEFRTTGVLPDKVKHVLMLEHAGFPA